MISWSQSEFNGILTNEAFLEKYSKDYQSKKDEFCKFLNNIELNTKYFRLTTNNKIGQNVRFKNKNISNDTIIIKEINSYLNKLTDKNKIVNLDNSYIELMINTDYMFIDNFETVECDRSYNENPNPEAFESHFQWATGTLSKKSTNEFVFSPQIHYLYVLQLPYYINNNNMDFFKYFYFCILIFFS